MEDIQEVAVDSQAAHPPENSGEIHPRRKTGVVIVRSAELGSPFFHGPRPGRSFPVWDDNEDWSRRMASVRAL
jgi:hypothetical protein